MAINPAMYVQHGNRKPYYIKIHCSQGGFLLLDRKDFRAGVHTLYDETKEPTYPQVPRLWPGETFVILGDGPSLTAEDVELVRGQARVIAVNYSIRKAPWADAYCSWHTFESNVTVGFDLGTWQGRVFTVQRKSKGTPENQFGVPQKDTKLPDNWMLLRALGRDGLSLDRTGIHHGFSSGHTAINLAVHLGAKRIVLLGFDCCDAPDGTFNWAKRKDDPSKPTYRYDLWKQSFQTLVEPLERLGVEIVNATRWTALECFPRAVLEQVTW
jgi:hypothetical protein